MYTLIQLQMELDKLTLCPVCYEIIKEPVVFPCDHEICLGCFNKSLETANHYCPLCRKRISSWARKNVNNPVSVERKREIEEAISKSDKDNICPTVTTASSDSKGRQLSKPGEIRDDYLSELEKVREELLLEETRNEEEAQKLQMEEEEQWQKVTADCNETELLGEVAAKCLQEEEHGQEVFDEQMAEILSQDFIMHKINAQNQQVKQDRKLARKLSENCEDHASDASSQRMTTPKSTKKMKLDTNSCKPITFWLQPLPSK